MIQSRSPQPPSCLSSTGNGIDRMSAMPIHSETMHTDNFIRSIVTPLLKQYQGHPNNSELAFALAIFLEQLPDYIKLDTGRSLTEIRNSIETRFPDFKYLRAVALSTKHVEA